MIFTRKSEVIHVLLNKVTTISWIIYICKLLKLIGHSYDYDQNGHHKIISKAKTQKGAELQILIIISVVWPPKINFWLCGLLV